MKRRVPVTIEGDEKVWVEIQSTMGEEEVGILDLDLDRAFRTVEKVAKSMAGKLKALGPEKVELEFEIAFEVESGELTALIVSGKGEGSLRICLTWEKGRSEAEAGAENKTG